MHQEQKLQKILAILILVLVPTFILKEYKNLTLIKREQGFKQAHIIDYEFTANKEKHFVFSLEHQKCDEKMEGVLAGIFSQEYQNYQIFYFYESCCEKELQDVKNYIATQKKKERVTYIKKEKEKNKYAQMAPLCKKTDVIVDMNFSDCFINSEVLTRICCEYQDPDVWLTYCNYEVDDKKSKTYLEPLINRKLKDLDIKKDSWMKAHMRTFYAGLIHEIQDNPNDSAAEKAFIFSVLKIGRWHVKFISDELTIYHQN